MFSISSCPQCGRQVSIPQGTDASVEVRCPLCGAQYALQSVLDKAPPMLEVVGRMAAVAAASQSTWAGQAAASPTAPSDDDLLGLPDLHSSDLDDLSVTPPAADKDELVDFESHDFEPGDAGSALDDQSFGHDHGAGHDQLELEPREDNAPAIALGTSDESKVPAFVPTPRKKKKEPSALGNIISMVAAAPVGLGLGYFILLWIGGPEKDFLKIGKKLPSWMVPASFSAPAATGGDATPKATGDGSTPNEPAKKSTGEVARSSDKKRNTSDLPELPDKFPDAMKSRPDDKAGTPAPGPTDNKQPQENGSAADSGDSKSPSPPDDEKAPANGKENNPFEELETEGPMPPLATDVPAAPEEPGLLNPPEYTLDQVRTAITEFDSVSKALAAAPADKKDEIKKLKGQFYRKIYRVADMVTSADMVRSANNDPADPQLQEHVQSVEKTLRDLAADPKKATEMGRAASQWLKETTNRNGEQGIVLAGKVQQARQLGRLFELRIALPGNEAKVVSVLTAADPKLKADDQVAVAGTIVDNPARALVAYEGNEPQVIWTRMALGVDATQP